MPLFNFGGSPIEQEIEKATQETIIKEDVSVMYEICDLVNVTPDGHKEAYRCLMKRLQNTNPRVMLLTLSLFDIFVMNCGRMFHLEVCSRDFISQCKNILAKAHPRVQDKLKYLLTKWVSNEFKSDSQLAIIENFIQKCKLEGTQFDVQEPTLDSMDSKPQTRNGSHHNQKQEEDDIAKAIELSLQETKKKEESTLYPSVGKMMSLEATVAAGSTSNPISGSAPKSREIRKVRALYDFEAAEENELSFKAGEVIIVLEDRDPNWWKGSNHRGEGLFPANFVSSDLEASPAEEVVSVVETPQVQQVTHVDEVKIDTLLQMLHDADPTTLQRTEQDSKMETLEAECNLMNPLIDAELEKIDRRHASLSNLSRRLNDALAMYHHLLRQPQMPFNPPVMMTPQQIPQGVPQMPYYPPGPPVVMPGYPGMPQGMPPMNVLPQPPMMGAPNGVTYPQEQF